MLRQINLFTLNFYNTKNLFLTIALMCCATFAFANDGDKKENPKMKETVEQKVVSNENVSFGVECFGLSCTTHCVTLTFEPTIDDTIAYWYFLENFWCGR